MKHARQRLEERGESDVTIKQLERALKDEEPLFLKRMTKTRSLAAIYVGPLVFFAIIDRKQRTLVTVLTHQMAAGRMRMDIPTLLLRVEDMRKKVHIPLDNTRPD